MLTTRLTGWLASLRDLLVAHWRALLVVFALVLLPLIAFAEIAEDLLEREPIPHEVPLMLWIYSHSSPGLDRVAAVFSILGGPEGMVPIGLGLVILLFFTRHRLALFALLSLGGVTVLNVVMKLFFERPRPTLWTPALPESDSSSPSGHAMFATALAATIVVVLWQTRWRWLALGLGIVYALTMMASRVYIGVHYPTDVLAGAAFSLAWVVGLTVVLRPDRWSSQLATTDPETPEPATP